MTDKRSRESERLRLQAWRKANPKKVQEHNKAWRAKSLPRYILQRSKRRAARKEIPFELDEKWVAAHLASGVCEATALPLDLSGDTGPWVPSIDRIDSNVGYIPANCQIVVYVYNMAKGSWSENTLLTLAKALVEKKSND